MTTQPKIILSQVQSAPSVPLYEALITVTLAKWLAICLGVLRKPREKSLTIVALMGGQNGQGLK